MLCRYGVMPDFWAGAYFDPSHIIIVHSP
jgi:hypothetical protein